MIQIFSSKRFTHIRSTDLSTSYVRRARLSIPSLNAQSSLPLGRSTLYSLRFSRGFTAIEILVVVAIIALLASVGTIMGFDTIGRASVHSERDLFVSLLTSARARALANVNESAHGIQINTNDFTIFEVPLSGVVTNQRVIARSSNITIAVGTSIIFDQLRANVSTGVGSYTMSDGTQTASVIINSEGRIDW